MEQPVSVKAARTDIQFDQDSPSWRGSDVACIPASENCLQLV